MSFPSRFRVNMLRTALDREEWTKVKQLLAQAPASPPEQGSSTELAASLDETRGVADTLAEACSFNTAFEKSFEIKRALHRAGACEWALRTLQGFAAFEPIVSRVGLVLGMLGVVGVEGRGLVGKIGAVDEMTKLWRRHSSCVELVSALVSLCSGHIDNVSRVMRQRGLVIAMDVLRGAQVTHNPILIEQTLLLIGFCAICTPDNAKEGNGLVPVLVEVLEQLKGANLPNLARHAISAVGNICDCWLKELDGYQIDDPQRLISAIVGIWTTNSESNEITSVAAWSLVSLMSANSMAKAAVLDHGKAIVKAAQLWKMRSSACRALVQMMKELGADIETLPMEAISRCRNKADSRVELEAGQLSEPSTSLRRRGRRRQKQNPAGSDTSIDTIAPDVTETRLPRAGAHTGFEFEPNLPKPSALVSKRTLPRQKRIITEKDDVREASRTDLAHKPGSEATPQTKSQADLLSGSSPQTAARIWRRQLLSEIISDGENDRVVPPLRSPQDLIRKRRRMSYRLQSDSAAQQLRTTQRVYAPQVEPEVIVISSDSDEEPANSRPSCDSARTSAKGFVCTASPTGIHDTAADTVRRSGRRKKVNLKYSRIE